MKSRAALLQFICRRCDAGRPPSRQDLASELGVSERALDQRLERLLAGRFIRPVLSALYGPDRQPADPVKARQFQITRRGRQRLEWEAKRQGPSEGLW